jgi:hypothetical protein
MLRFIKTEEQNPRADTNREKQDCRRSDVPTKSAPVTSFPKVSISAALYSRSSSSEQIFARPSAMPDQKLRCRLDTVHLWSSLEK